MLGLVGHCFESLWLLLPNPQVHVLRKDHFLQNLLHLSCKIAACGDQFHGLPADMTNTKDTAVALHSSSHPHSLWSAIHTAPNLPSLLVQNFLPWKEQILV